MKLTPKNMIASLACILTTSCGSMLSEAPTIEKRSLAAGPGGVEFIFEGLLKASDELPKEDGAENEFAGLIMESQLTLLKVNKAEANLVSVEKGRCLLFYQGDQDLANFDLSADFGLSEGGRVLYSLKSDFESNQCQELFETEISEFVREDFFSIHISFFSMTH